jgi:hypothetical protein
VTDWPAITEPQLLERLAMTSEEFDAHLLAVTRWFGARAYDAAVHTRALAYPWARPEGSYVLTGSDVEPLAAMDDARRRATVARFAGATGEGRRFPLLAYGSNGAPDALVAKFAHFPDADRDVLVLAGTLHDFDVGPSAQMAAYGAMPATLLASPGTAVRCAVLWVNLNQFVQLTWTEISYCLGRLDSINFAPDDGAVALDSVLAFVSRFGTFCPDGEPVALAAIPAEHRTVSAMSQADLLDAAARIALGEGATSEDLVRELFTDYPAFTATRRAAINAASAHFASDSWVPFPTQR